MSPICTSGHGTRTWPPASSGTRTGFQGAELRYSELLAAEDQRRTALDFMRERYRALQEG